MNKPKFPIHHDTMLNCSVRYALGRRSHIVGMTIDYVIANYNTLSKECKDIIVSDIEDAIGRRDLGDKEDEIQWTALLKFIRMREGLKCRKQQ